MPIYLYNSRPLKLDPPWSDSHRRRSSRAKPERWWGFRRWRKSLAKRRGATVKGGRAAAGAALCGRSKATSATCCTRFAWEIRWTTAEAGEWKWSPKRGGKEDSFTIYHFSRRATFYLPCNDASNQTVKTIGIDMRLQDLAFESPIWQDPLYVLKARSLHPLDTPKTLTVHHDINRRM